VSERDRSNPRKQSAGAGEADERPAEFLNRWSARKQRAKLEASLPASTPSPAESSGTAPVHHNDTNPGIQRATDFSGNQPSLHTLPAGMTDSPTVLTPPVANLITTSPDLSESEQGEIAQDVIELSDVDMPPIETLTAQSDLSGFFSKGVSAALRRSALRFVFRQPQYNVRDGLNDYDGDYTVFEPLGDTITADMKFHAARKERDRIAAEKEAAELAEQERDAQNADTAEAAEHEHEHEQIEAETEAEAEAEQSKDQNAPVTETDPGGRSPQQTDIGVDDAQLAVSRTRQDLADCAGDESENKRSPS